MRESAPAYLGFKMLFGSRASNKATKHLIGAILGIGLSLVPLITVIQASGGLIEGITRRFIEIGSYHLQVKTYSPVEEEQRQAALKMIANTAGVTHAFPVVFGEGLVYSPSGKTGVSVRSLPGDYYRSDAGIAEYLSIEAGEFQLESRQDAMLSAQVAEKLNVKVGDRVRLLTAKPMPGRAPILRPSFFTVKGVFSTGYYELDALSMYIPVDTGKVLFDEPGNYTIGVKLDNPYQNAGNTAQELLKRLSNNWYVYTWYSLERPMLDSFRTTRNLLIFVMALIVLVATVNISSSMIMLVLEKEPEIAMLKSVGVAPGTITKSFLYTGIWLGTVATVVGISIGLVAAVNINALLTGLELGLNSLNHLVRVLFSPFFEGESERIKVFDESFYLETIPIRLEFVEIFLTGAGALLASTLAAYFPARRAGKIKPLEIFRKH
jgi:lipoprotein-releasing system permease protein